MRAYVLKSLCKHYRYKFDMNKKLDRAFYDKIIAGIPNKMTELMSDKPEEWDITVLIDFYYEKKEEVFKHDLVASATPKNPLPFEVKKMDKKWGVTKACLARIRYMRNKLAHAIQTVVRMKGSKAYNAAEAAWSFFK